MMKFLTHQSFYSIRNPISSYRLLSSVSFCPNSSIFTGEDSNLSAPFDPLQFFADQSNSRHCTLETARILHAVLLRRHSLPHDVFFSKSLLNWYTKSASMVDARKLFDTIPQPDVVSCNIMISGYNQNNLFDESWGFFRLMQFLSFELNEITYRCVLSACCSLQAPLLTKLIYSDAIKKGYFLNDTVRSALIDTFSKIGSFEDAYKVFRDVSCNDNVYCWNVVIGGALRNHRYSIVLDLVREMCSGLCLPDGHTYPSVLAACAALEKLRFGKEVQAQVIKCSPEDVVACTAVVNLYAKCGRMAMAWKAFSLIPNPNVVSWTALLSGCGKDNDGFSALAVFDEMRKLGTEINSHTVTSVISACAKPSMFCEAVQIHGWVLKSGFLMNPAVTSALINVYSKMGKIDLSELVFEESDHVQSPDLGNLMISSFSQNQKHDQAVKLFTAMLQKGFRPDEFSVCSLLSGMDCLNLGKQIHCYALKNGLVNVSVGSSLFTMYSKCGHLEDSFKVYQEMPVRDNVCWTSMISGFSEHGYPSEAIKLFKEMLSEGAVPDETTLSAVLTACSSLSLLLIGKEIHSHALRAEIDKGSLIGSSLVNMYSKCGSLKLARQVYDGLTIDTASCSSLISGYSQHGLVEDGFLVFQEMIMSDFAMDSFTVSSMLGAVTHSDISSLGAQIHAYITKIGLFTQPSVGTSLVKMYSKFGSIEDCCKAFSQIYNPDLIAWTTLIASYAQHGKAVEALQVYTLMKDNGIKPDKVTFVEILSACSHGGLVEEGYALLNSMAKDYGIEPEIRHYVSMVDALGRSGRLKEAERFVNDMPIKPNALVWGTLLAACKLYGDVELAKLAAKKVIVLEPSDSGSYISLSNVLAEVGEWDEVEEIRNLMKRMGVRKEPGWSSI
ncbi:PREDICTED: pentatricopeptide repeat-containing protein At1g74600, chloroplastic [Tarenaya hassleriana]|uniref:pentatricopeptide repeat-containing protein At1g74600, chloroplastic n=1 Tax=Tarenaya hassleriana TaxID=28532 RepID=UPI00053C365B|nr:PREDICTED: pentatricopeptide repeat-containing protein At1g74600, chloroplastic [Tarenaya hassleriana]